MNDLIAVLDNFLFQNHTIKGRKLVIDKKPKPYKPFTHKVVGYEGPFVVTKAFKNYKAALKFSKLLRNAEIYEMKLQ